MSDRLTPAQLLADAVWLKRLAIRLAGDADDADDLVQESWIAAWRREPDAGRPLRPWLAKVLRDLAIMRRRADRRRETRDQAWDGSDAPASPEDLLEQVRLHYGLVIDAAGGPIAGAQLLRQDAIGSESDGSGAYQLCLPPSAPRPEQLLVVVRAAGYGTVALAAAPAGRVRHNFVLTPEATLGGVAVTEAGTLVTGANIWAEPDDGEIRPDGHGARVTAISDADGRFQLTVAGGRHRVGGLGEGLSAPPLVVSVGAGESRELSLRMLGVGVLRGRVVHGAQPVAGARITAGAGFASAVSQADGSFVLAAVPTGKVTLRVAPYRLRAPGELGVVAGENPPVELAVEPLARLHGVVHRGGAPVAGARLQVRGPTPMAAQADAQGRYAIEGLEPGAYQLDADDTRLVAYTDGVKLSLALGEDRELDLDLATAGRAAGQVVDAAGAPVTSAHVLLMRKDRRDEGHCVSDEKGAFVCGQLAGGEYTATVSPAAMGAAPFAFASDPPAIVVAGPQASVEGVRLVVVPTRRTIEGVVVDSAGEPIADARVQVATGASDGRATHALISAPSGVSGVDGRFRIEDLAGGRYTLLVRTRDGARSEHRGFLAGSKDVRLVVAATCEELSEQVPALAAKPEVPVVWDERVELLGWNLPAVVRRNQEFEVTFVYRVRRPIERSWRTFVHIDGAETRLSADHEPLGGRCPMAAWQPGDVIVDRFHTRFTADHPAGEYMVWTGFFLGWAGRWTNMPVSEAADTRRGKGDRVRVAPIILE